MALTKIKKQKIIQDLEEKIKKQKMIVFLDFTGIKVKDFFNLRKKLKKENAELKVTKKTLLAIAFKKINESLAEKIKKMEGEIALVFGYQDIIPPAKIVWQFSKDFPNLKILAGFVENELKDKEVVFTLAQLPSREEILANLLRTISFPVFHFNDVLKANIKGLLNVLAKAKNVILEK